MKLRWKPNVTVAAIVERGGKYLLVEEHSADSPAVLLLNNPAGHLEPGESLIDACVRETLEETACAFTPTALVGVYLARPAAGKQTVAAAEHEADLTYLRFAFTGTLGEPQPGHSLDIGIERTLWLTLDEIRASQDRHRSPLLLRCVEDHAAGQSHPLSLLQADPSLFVGSTP